MSASNHAPTPKWIRIGDRIAMFVVTLIVAGGFWAWGYAGADYRRAWGWLGCALLGAWGMIGWSVGRLDGADRAGLRWILVWLGAFVLIAGAQNYAMDRATIEGISPEWNSIIATQQATGITPTEKLSLALSPHKARVAWDQAFAIFLFAFGVCTLGTRRGGALFLVVLAVTISLLEGILGVGVFVFKGVSRAFGAIYNPNHHAALAVMALPVAISLLHVLPHYRRRFRSDMGGGRNPLLPLYALILGCTLGWLASLSRSSIAFGGLVLGVWGAFEYRRISARKRRSGGDEGESKTAERVGKVVIGIGAVGAFAILATLFAGDFVGRVEELKDVRAIDRIENARATLEGLQITDGRGTGLGGTEYILNREAEYSTSSAAIHTHNDYVEVLGDLGYLGAGLLAVLALIFIWRAAVSWMARREWSSENQRMIPRAAMVGAITVLLHSATDFPLRIPLITMQLLLLAVIAFGDGATRIWGRK